MPDTFTFMIFGYGTVVGGLMIYVVSLGIRQHLLEQKKKRLAAEKQEPTDKQVKQ